MATSDVTAIVLVAGTAGEIPGASVNRSGGAPWCSSETVVDHLERPYGAEGPPGRS